MISPFRRSPPAQRNRLLEHAKFFMACPSSLSRSQVGPALLESNCFVSHNEITPGDLQGCGCAV
ncbi:hypothetical protein M404DRAFT_998757 [Pisolithus tinctorius Marx 270]|uniref:Uncharacterized protein n=1 Tax=Pisolithus tinctorius Marx 270 TaxID=870435 RepID=A0A0C3KAF1_PISTI|nr:hypothetical protein M404DRAFT_998757 [Pisolithus tinctorius Marx 270]